MNFTYPGKGSTEFGMQIADGLTADLSKNESFATVDRDDLRNVIQKERLSNETQQSPSISRWLADKLHANAVLVGEIAKNPDDLITVSARLFSANPSKNKTLSLKGTLQIDPSLVHLSPSEDLPVLPPFPNEVDGQAVYPIGVGTLPWCSYTRNPAFTDAAREAHISGIILAEVIVGTDRRVRNVRILKGLPTGLNENTLHTLPRWRCTPAKKEGKPVPTKVVFEVNFRL
jgi:Gram-negative bacterial TonB protein C-terminal